MKVIRILSLVAFGSFFTANLAPAQTWTLTSAPTNNWAGVAMSADGAKIVAVAGGGSAIGPIYSSTNSGATWISNDAPKLDWIAICSSADGTKLAANIDGGGIWTNSGTSWKQTPSPATGFLPSSIASAADGNTLLAGAFPTYLSTNRGKTWQALPSPNSGGAAGEGVAMSADATVMLVNGDPFLSTNSGMAWFVATNFQTEMRAAAASVDGVKLFAMGDAGVWASMNSGVWWFKETNAPTSSFGSIASSADGTRLILARRFLSAPLYISTNSGLAWTTANVSSNYWSTVATSADGNTLAAAINGGGIWIARTTPAPAVNITPTNGNLKFSWLVPSTNFVLQQSADLSGWTDLTNQPALNLTNLQNEVSLPFSGSGGFYRLKTP